MKAYTYLLRHNLTGQLYYGVRKSETFDILQTYFTSSQLVKRILKEEGQVFTAELRQKFESYSEARSWETRFLTKVKCVSNQRFLNQAVSAPRIPIKDSVQEAERCAKISKTMKLRWSSGVYAETFRTPEAREKARKAGALGGSKRTASLKPKKVKVWPSEWKLITIQRGDTQKQIRQNQLSAYRKCGYEMVRLCGCAESNRILGLIWTRSV
jgi:hypothetical protein